MRSHSPVEVHAPLIRALAAEKDWAGLTRYWLAHQYVGALDEALILIDRTATRKGGPWLRLARFMEDVRRDPASPDRKLGHVDQGPWNDAERATIHLLMLLPRVVLCERAPYAEENRRSQLFQDGLEACKAARDLSEKIGDRAASAFFLRLIANAYLGLGLPSEAGSIHPGAPDDRLPTALRLVQSDSKSQSQGDSHLLEQAQDHLKEALKIYREMTSEQPKVYRTHVTETLKALGTLEHLLSESGIAATKWWWPFSTQSPRGRWFRSALPL